MGKSMRDRTKAELIEIIKDLKEELKGKNEEIKKLSAHTVKYDLTNTAVSAIRESGEYKVVIVKYDPESGAAKMEEIRSVKPHGRAMHLAENNCIKVLIEEIFNKL
jgi:hypothetical protein